MKVAVTGCTGDVGKRVVIVALKQGYSVVGIDMTPAKDVEFNADPNFKFVQADLRDYDETLEAIRGCDGVIQLAGVRWPADYVATTHNTNVTITWNVLRAAAELGINRIAQASSVNVITLVFAVQNKFEYFPIDEDHPAEPDEPYGLSKLICEIQADAIVRRYPSMRVASIRLHWSVPTREAATRDDPARRAKDLWGWVQEDSGAEAFLLAVFGETGKWSGHERFFVAAPDIATNEETMGLKDQFWPDVPIRDGHDLSGRKSFFDCSKAERLLDWVHRVP
ncbi:NAD(P)-binding protein [Rhodofomes roseus]|uniref:NAD(P)-binding protein n=2 Tax=Rhodofomes roseus TaxID=34475 RepID=A0ABQ8KJN8_9APHY|nr:NAD(P)-binding protein [Rhodofomes roseus]KAH9838344.1 NAD(P)-binding protein [Rhodofomes roseus]